MSNDITLKAPEDADERLKKCKEELEIIGNLKNKLGRLFSRDRENKLKQVKGNLETQYKELWRLSKEFNEDGKFVKEVQKILDKCKKMCKSYGIKTGSIKVGARMCGQSIKHLIKLCKLTIDETAERCSENREAFKFINTISGYRPKIMEELSEAEYADTFVVKKIVEFVASFEVLCKKHWERVVKSQEEISKLLAKKNKEFSDIQKGLEKGNIDWGMALQDLANIYEYIKSDENSISKGWKKGCYFSVDSIKTTFDNGAVVDSIIDEMVDKNNYVWFRFGERNPLDASCKGELKEAVKKKLRFVFSITDANKIQESLEKIFENSFKAIKESIKERKKFEEACRKMIIRETTLYYGSRLAKKDDNDATVYDIVNNNKSIREMDQSQYEFCVIEYINDVITKDIVLGNTKDEVVSSVHEIWETRGHFQDKKNRKRYYLNSIPGVIKAE